MKKTQTCVAGVLVLLGSLALAGVFHLTVIFPKTMAVWADEGRALSVAEQTLVNLAFELQQSSAAVVPDIRTIESADAVLILGEDVTNTAPRIALALRQSVRNKAYELAAQLRLETWQDAAIRNLAQEQRSPLYIATVANTPLDDVATQRYSLAPDAIAGLGQAVAAGIAKPASSSAHSAPGDAAGIAAALAGA